MATFTSPGWASAPDSNNNKMNIADKDYDLDENGKLTTDPAKAAFHLIRKGQEVPFDVAEKYGIGKKAPAKDSEVKAAVPTENKAKTPTSNK